MSGYVVEQTEVGRNGALRLRLHNLPSGPFVDLEGGVSVRLTAEARDQSTV